MYFLINSDVLVWWGGKMVREKVILHIFLYKKKGLFYTIYGFVWDVIDRRCNYVFLFLSLKSFFIYKNAF